MGISNFTVEAGYIGGHVFRIKSNQFLKDLPESIDPCGENGEFHTFVYDSPLFKKSIKFTLGDIVKRTYKPVTNGSNCHKDNTTWDSSFWYADLIPN
mgnify:CR=1 FL=1